MKDCRRLVQNRLTAQQGSRGGWSCVSETRGHFSLEERGMRTYERIMEMAGDLQVFSSDITEDSLIGDVKACCR